MKYLLGIDPGLATGVYCVDMENLEELSTVLSEEFSIQEFHDFIEPYLEKHKDEIHVVIEDYLITARTAKLSQQPWSLRLIGVVVFLCYKYDIPLTIQKPKDKEFADNTKLKKIGFWRAGGAGHSMDGARHVLIWLVNHYPQVAKAFLT